MKVIDVGCVFAMVRLVRTRAGSALAVSAVFAATSIPMSRAEAIALLASVREPDSGCTGTTGKF